MSVIGDTLAQLARRLEGRGPWLDRSRKAVRLLRRQLARFGIRLPRVAPPAVGQIKALGAEAVGSGTIGAQGPRVLFYSPRGWPTHLALEWGVAIGLHLRGATCSFATCGLEMPICNIANCNTAPPMPCRDCSAVQLAVFDGGPFEHVSKKSLVPGDALRQARNTVAALAPGELAGFEHNGLPLGRLVQISVRWFMMGEDVASAASGVRTYRDFLVSAIVTADAAARLLRDNAPDVVFMLNGLFFEERIMYEMARREGIPVITYERAFHRNHYVFARNRMANHYELEDHWGQARDTALTRTEEEWLDGYLMDWRKGSRSHVKYWVRPEERARVIREKLGIGDGERLVVLFSNIVWDSAVQERDVAFDGLWGWINSTIRYFSEHMGPDTKLVVRVHPAEVRLEGRETREGIVGKVLAEWPELPPNVRVIGPEDELSSYVLIELADVVLVYTSTVGLEAALAGRPVVVAGQTHYRDKGFTFDARSRDEYFELLRSTLRQERSSEHRIRLARRYAYLFFRRYMIELPFVDEPRLGYPTMSIDSLEELKPGRQPGLDSLCDFVLASAGNQEAAALVD